MKPDLIAARGRVHKLSFFIHNLMDACDLDKERVDACVFMAATGDGAVSMCVHNAERERYLPKPVAIALPPRLGRRESAHRNVR